VLLSTTSILRVCLLYCAEQKQSKPEFTPKSSGYLPQGAGPLCQLYLLSIYADQLSKAMSFIIGLQFFFNRVFSTLEKRLTR
jgi:hypothetical protein